MILKTALAAIFGLSLLLTSCWPPDQPAPPAPSTSESQPATEEKTYEGVGLVQRVDKDGGIVVLQHEEIEGFMAAMTMPFVVERDELLAGVQPGDKVRFTLRHSSKDTRIVQIERAQ